MASVRDPNARSLTSTLLVGAGFAGGGARYLLDSTRTAKKLPEVWRTSGGLGVDGFKNATHLIGQAVTAAPTTKFLNPESLRFTRFDRVAYKTSYAMGAALAGIQLASAWPNLHDGLRDGGAGLVNTRPGRTGLISAIGGATAVGALARGAHLSHRAGTRGAWQLAQAAVGHRVNALPMVVGLGIASAISMFANERGLLDFLNEGDERSPLEVFDEVGLL